MINSIDASLAALSAFSEKLSVTAGNVANMTTDGYKRTEATITEDSQGLPEVTTRKMETPGPIVQDSAGTRRELSNVDLSQEIPQMIVAQRGYEANLKALETQGSILKSTIDLLA
jgi:flagellar basal body rod protein FlgG